MDQFGISRHPLNHEKAMKAYLDDRAEALFDVDERHPLADRSLSEFTGGSRQNRRSHASPVVQEETTPITAQPSAPLATATMSKPLEPPEPPAIMTLDLRPTPPPNVAEDAEAATARPVVLVADFEAECEKLIKNMKDAWDEGTARDARALVRMLKSVLEEHDVQHSGQITQYHLGLLRQHFNAIPTRWGQSARMRAVTAPELRTEGEKLRSKPKRTARKRPSA